MNKTEHSGTAPTSNGDGCRIPTALPEPRQVEGRKELEGGSLIAPRTEYRPPIETICTSCGGKSVGPCPMNACKNPEVS